MLTKLLNEADDLLKSKHEELDAQRLKVITELLNRKLNLVKYLDEKIIEACKVELIEHEMEKSEEIKCKLQETQRARSGKCQNYYRLSNWKSRLEKLAMV